MENRLQRPVCFVQPVNVVGDDVLVGELIGGKNLFGYNGAADKVEFQLWKVEEVCHQFGAAAGEKECNFFALKAAFEVALQQCAKQF